MSNPIKTLVAFVAMLPALAAAQGVPSYPQNLPPNSVVGRLGVGPGPSQAIPFSQLQQILGKNTVPNSQLAQSPAATLLGNPTAATGNKTDFTIQGLPNKVAPDPAVDRMMIFDVSTGTFKNCTVAQCVSGLPAPPFYAENLLSNSGFQLMAGVGLVTKQAAEGTGGLLPFNVNSISNVGSIVTINITPSSLNQIKPNFLVQLYTGCAAGILPIQAGSTGIFSALRVLTITGNPVSSFTVMAPLGVTSFAPSSCLGTVMTTGDYTASNGNGPSQWTKTAQTWMWAENDPVNFDTIGGSTQVIGLKQTSSSLQYLYQTLPPAQTVALQGQKFTCAARIKQKIKISSTAKMGIFANSVWNYGALIGGALDTWQWASVTVTINSAETQIVPAIVLSDDNGGVFYVTKPICAQVASMPTNYYSAPINETIFAPGIFNVWSIYGKTFTMPSTTLGTSPLYGFYIDFFGETAGQIHWTATGLIGDIEGDATALPTTMMMGNKATGTVIPGCANMVSQVVNVTMSMSCRPPLFNGQAFIATGQPSRTYNNFNVDLFGITTNGPPLQ
ncbi:hypothetical protein [Tardiphaga sp.]|uniref:hypothetical protein n=1 Tax=Tardiphaga sp. TaxID=1926292 RepID=UPI0026170F46|nr:hypothetical protein [Tardiphaga sp.]MDB5616600.1 hypothetical protein [Tardiphaga sp.]